MSEIAKLATRLSEEAISWPNQAKYTQLTTTLDEACSHACQLDKNLRQLFSQLSGSAEMILQTTLAEGPDKALGGYLNTHVTALKQNAQQLQAQLNEIVKGNDGIDAASELASVVNFQSSELRQSLEGFQKSGRQLLGDAGKWEQHLKELLEDIFALVGEDLQEVVEDAVQRGFDEISESLQEIFEEARGELEDYLAEEVGERIDVLLSVVASEIAEELAKTIENTSLASGMATALAPYQPQLTSISAAAPAINAALRAF